MAGPFQNFRRPVVYILDQELRKRDLKNKIKLATSEDELPMYPVEIVKDNSTGKTVKCIHGTGSNQWSEEFIRVGGKVVQIITTYPDGSSDTVQITRDPKVHYLDKL
jgi:hypothetical protein